MEDEKNKSNILTKKRSLWSGGYIVAGLIYYFSYENNFAKTTVDQFIVLVVAIMAGVLYSRLKKRIRFMQNDIGKGIVAAIVLIIVSAFLIGGLTRVL